MIQPGKQFEQMGLFPEDSVPQGGPAFQSPEEFRDDPRTVFHASYRKIPEPGESLPSSFPGIHSGTYQSALERAGSHGHFDPYTTPHQERADNSRRGEVNPHIVMQPLSTRGMPIPEGNDLGSVGNPMTDDEANNDNIVKHAKSARTYTNNAEDIGKLSVVFPSRPDLMRQGDWVRKQRNENYQSGAPKDQGIHPRTSAMYDAGILDNYDMRTREQVRAETDPQTTDHHLHDGGLFPYTESTKRPPTDPNDVWPKWDQRLMSREELSGISKQFGSTNDIVTDPYTDRDVKGDSWASSSRRNNAVGELEDVRSRQSGERGKKAYSNNYSSLTHDQRYPGLGDIERTAPTAREDRKNQAAALQQSQINADATAMAASWKNTKTEAPAKKVHDPLGVLDGLDLSPQKPLGPRSASTGKRYDPNKPISMENPSPAYKSTPGVNTPPLPMDKPKPHNVGAQFGGAGTPKTMQAEKYADHYGIPYNTEDDEPGGKYY